jgi:hypothetical protein
MKPHLHLAKEPLFWLGLHGLRRRQQSVGLVSLRWRGPGDDGIRHALKLGGIIKVGAVVTKKSPRTAVERLTD